MRMLTKFSIEKFGDILFKSSLVVFVVFTPISIAITEGAFWLALIGYVMNKLSGRKPLFCATGVGKPIIAFIAVLAFTSLFSIKPLYSLSSIGAFRYFFLYYVLANYGLERDFIRRLVGLIILMAVIWSGCEIFRHFLTQSLRLNVYTAHINVLVIPIMVGLLITGRIDKKGALFLSFLFILSMASFLSLSRAAWLGAFASVAVVLFYRNWKILLLLASVTVVVTFIAGAYYPDSTIGGLIKSIINPFQPGGARSGSNMARLQMLRDTMSILMKDPFTGIGPEAYKFVSTIKHMRISMDHVQILATAGFIGFAAYVWLQFAFIQRCSYIEQSERKRGVFSLYHVLSICLFAAFIGFLVCGSFEPMFFSTKRLRFIMLLLGINEGLLRAANYEKESNSPAFLAELFNKNPLKWFFTG